ncbi:hypothetical protein BKA66DRAFT_569119 [Pyrenochaeta sp. MPI-SDFR-AT-0127]|nr:hypothetical protein BKA66DRAFT_569119 [Pyrenochaeta sp. MPI-SDFR-AT-0127]
MSDDEELRATAEKLLAADEELLALDEELLLMAIEDEELLAEACVEALLDGREMLVEDDSGALLVVTVEEELDLWLLWLAVVEPNPGLLDDVRVESVVELAEIAEELEARDRVNDEECREADDSLEVALDVSCDRVLDTELPEDLWLELRESDLDIELLCTPVHVPKPSWQPRDALQWSAVFPHQCAAEVDGLATAAEGRTADEEGLDFDEERTPVQRPNPD